MCSAGRPRHICSSTFLTVLNCSHCYIFRHLKLEMLTQYPATNNEKYLYVFWKCTSSKLNDLTNCTSRPNYIIHFSDILFGLIFNIRKYMGAAGVNIIFLSRTHFFIFGKENLQPYLDWKTLLTKKRDHCSICACLSSFERLWRSLFIII